MNQFFLLYPALKTTGIYRKTSRFFLSFFLFYNQKLRGENSPKTGIFYCASFTVQKYNYLCMFYIEASKPPHHPKTDS